MQLTVRDAARLLNVTEETLYRWIEDQAAPACRVGDQYRFNRAELLEWATSRRIAVSPEMFVEENGKAALPKLVDALRAGGIAYRVAGGDKPSVLQSIVRLMKLPEEMDPEFLYQVLMAREMLGSTGIGDGIAIPHVRNPIVLQMVDPMITLCFLEHPVDFGSLDGQPVATLFTMVSPTIRVHLHLLSRLGFVLRDPEVKNALKGQAPAETILDTMAQSESKIPGNGGR